MMLKEVKVNIPKGKKAVVIIQGNEMLDEALHEARCCLNNGGYVRFRALPWEEWGEGYNWAVAERDATETLIAERGDSIEVVRGEDGFSYIHVKD